ncbi:MAG TPA: hypothetical protein DCG85_01565 [Lachnospiraceae bacterium]|nr:hypothetical protein [Lachnospiraceae bacterium]
MIKGYVSAYVIKLIVQNGGICRKKKRIGNRGVPSFDIYWISISSCKESPLLFDTVLSDTAVPETGGVAVPAVVWAGVAFTGTAAISNERDNEAARTDEIRFFLFVIISFAFYIRPLFGIGIFVSVVFTY